MAFAREPRRLQREDMEPKQHLAALDTDVDDIHWRLEQNKQSQERVNEQTIKELHEMQKVQADHQQDIHSIRSMMILVAIITTLISGGDAIIRAAAFFKF